MFEYLRKFVFSAPDDPSAEGNAFFPVSRDDITACERMIGFRLPDQLRTFYEEIGYGFLVVARGKQPHDRTDAVNRFSHPLQLAELYLGKTEFGPEEGFPKSELPFFETADNYYFVMHPFDDYRNSVYASRGGLISLSFEVFVKDLYGDPDFYNKLL